MLDWLLRFDSAEVEKRKATPFYARPAVRMEGRMVCLAL